MTDESVYDRPIPWSTEGGLNLDARPGIHRYLYKILSRKFDLDSGVETVGFLIRFPGSIDAVIRQLAEPAAIPSLLVNLRKWSNNDLSREITKWAVRPIVEEGNRGALEVVLQFQPHWWYEHFLRTNSEGISPHLGATRCGQRRVVQQSVSEPRISTVVSERILGSTS